MRLLIIFMFSFVLLAKAQDGKLDATFGNVGYVNFGDGEEKKLIVRTMAVTNQNKILLSGSEWSPNHFIWFCQLNNDGTIDQNFGTNGWVFQYTSSNAHVHRIRFDNNGNFYAFGEERNANGYFQVRLWKFSLGGSMMSQKTYGFNGIYTNRFGEVLRQSNGKFVLISGGHSKRLFIKRINQSGNDDMSFANGSGYNLTPIGVLGGCGAITKNDDILVGGFFQYPSQAEGAVVYKYLNNGQKDTSFGNNGKIVINIDYVSQPRFINELSSGKFLVTGFFKYGSKERMICFNENGTYDTTFFGILELEGNVGDVLVQPDDKILVFQSDSLQQLVLSRYLSNGEVDSTFNGIGEGELMNFKYHVTSGPCGALQNDGGILTAFGQYPFEDGEIVVSRHNSKVNIGMEENSLIGTNVVFFPNPVQHSARLQFTLLQNSKLDIVLIDIMGRKIKEVYSDHGFYAGKNEIQLEGFQELPDGTYFIQLISNFEQVSIPIVKKSE